MRFKDAILMIRNIGIPIKYPCAPFYCRQHNRVPVHGTAVPGDAADTRVIWYTHPRSNPVFTDCLRVPAGYTESVLVTFPQW